MLTDKTTDDLDTWRGFEPKPARRAPRHRAEPDGSAANRGPRSTPGRHRATTGR